MEGYERTLLDFEDYAEPFGIWTILFWGILITLAVMIMLYGGVLCIFEALFATLIFRIISWVGFEYYRCN